MSRFPQWDRMTILLLAASMFTFHHSFGVDAKDAAGDTQWTSTKISRLFFGEGGTLADFDQDGHMDVAAGYMLFFGPDFRESTPLHPSNPYNINGYSEYFFVFDADVDQDGDPDVLAIGFPGAAAYWYRNPGKQEARRGPWERFLVLDVVDNESPSFADLTGDGRPELICSTGGRYGYAEIPSEPTKPWTFRAVTEPGPYERFTHGLGIGDVNDDGRLDMMAKNGWWENPGNASEVQGTSWKFHAFEFSGPGGAQMYAVDLDGDGKSEVVTSLAAHGYGLVIYKKSKSDTGLSWTRQDIMTDKPETSSTGLAVSQLHAIDIADMDGDGKLDILTGKRFWAHNGHDPGENDPPLLVWFKPIAVDGGIRFIPNIIDNDSGVGTEILARDANGDGRTDVLSVSKRGVHLLIQTPTTASALNPHPRDVEGAVATESIAIDDSLGGFRPAWSTTEAMNFDFESADLRDWTASGGSFFNQPVEGDTIAARQKEASSQHQGKYWIGSMEIAGDVAMGTLTSRPFRVTHPRISFLMGGGAGNDVGCELVDHPSGTVLQTVRGSDSDTLQRVSIDATAWKGKSIYVRLFDRSRDGWGHVNFDDLRLHDAAP